MLIAVTIAFVVATPFVLFPSQLPIVGVGSFVTILAWTTGGIWCGRLDRPKSPTTLPILILLVMALIGTATSSHPTLSLPKLMSLCWGCIAWWLLQLWGKRLGIWGSLSVYLILGFGIGLVGIFSADWQPKLFTFALPATISLPEAPINGISPNQLAGTIIYFWPLLLVNWQRIPFKIMIVFWGGILIATQSRTAWISIFLVVLLFLQEHFPIGERRRGLLRRGALIIVLIGGTLLFTQLQFSEIASAWSTAPLEVKPGSLQSLGMRREIWRWGLVALSEYPLKGVGLGTFRVVINSYPAILPAKFDIAHAHNLFLQISLDVGLIGLAAYLYLIFIAGRHAFSLMNTRNNALARMLGHGYLLTLVAIHTFGLLDTIALGSKPALLFWLLLALIEITHDQICAPMPALMVPSTSSHQERPASEPVSCPH